MTTAIDTGRVERVVTRGASWLWLEGEAARHPRMASGERRDALRTAFVTGVMPSMRARGAKRRVLAAGGLRDAAAMHWAAWSTSDGRVVWALYADARRALEKDRPANDGARMVAWGDGPVMAWVDADPGLQRALRDALRDPPDFLDGGMVSGDATLPLKITRTA